MANLLLLLFALPIATIIIASVLETFFDSPIKVTALIFAIFLVVAFSAFDAMFLIYVLIYTILAFISAIVTRFILNFIDNNDDNNGGSNGNGNGNNNDGNSGCGCNRYYRNGYYR